MHPIAFHRHAKGWTQTDLARHADASLTAVQGWERGALPRPSKLAKLAELFAMNGEDLLREIADWRRSEAKLVA